jgi:hypothetical protein
MAPPAIRILPVKMVIFPWMNDKCYLAGSCGTSLFKCRTSNRRNIEAHEPFNNATTATLFVMEFLCGTLGSTGLMIHEATTLWFVKTLRELFRIQNIHTIGPTVMGVSY